MCGLPNLGHRSAAGPKIAPIKLVRPIDKVRQRQDYINSESLQREQARGAGDVRHRGRYGHLVFS